MHSLHFLQWKGSVGNDSPALAKLPKPSEQRGGSFLKWLTWRKMCFSTSMLYFILRKILLFFNHLDNYVRKTPNTVRNVFIEREYLIMSRLLSYQITRLVLIEVPSSGRFHKLKPTTLVKTGYRAVMVKSLANWWIVNEWLIKTVCWFICIHTEPNSLQWYIKLLKLLTIPMFFNNSTFSN